MRTSKDKDETIVLFFAGIIAMIIIQTLYFIFKNL